MKSNHMKLERAVHAAEQEFEAELSATTAAAPDTNLRLNRQGAEEGSADAILDEQMMMALRAISDKKGIGLMVLDLRPIAEFTDHFVIASCASTRQVQAIADEVTERLKKHGMRAARVEGYRTAEWVLIDYGYFVVHVFENAARRFYDLERLWRDAARVQLPSELVDDAGEGSVREAVNVIDV